MQVVDVVWTSRRGKRDAAPRVGLLVQLGDELRAARTAVGDRCRGKMCVNVLCRELVA
jgi:hypothetical protein